MKNRGVQSKKRYLLAFLIGTFIFVFIFSLIYSISYLEFQRISSLQEDIAYKIFKDKLDYSLFDKGICSNQSFKKISEDLGFHGRIINDLEKKLGKNDKRVLFRKKFYTLIELEHFEFVKIFNEKCNYEINTILFFYSNEDADIALSENIGKLLTVIHSRNDNLTIYSFDINLKSDLINKLKEKYNIEKSPTTIINENITIINPQSINEIEKYLV